MDEQWECGWMGTVDSGRKLEQVLKPNQNAQKLSLLSHLCWSSWPILVQFFLAPRAICNSSPCTRVPGLCQITSRIVLTKKLFESGATRGILDQKAEKSRISHSVSGWGSRSTRTVDAEQKCAPSNHTTCIHWCTHLYRTVTNSRAVSNREFRYPPRYTPNRVDLSPNVRSPLSHLFQVSQVRKGGGGRKYLKFVASLRARQLWPCFGRWETKRTVGRPKVDSLINGLISYMGE